ncbi:SpoIIE family protein phosphatase [Streptomyces sp. NPDC057684]|uniref:SpoIIE family protein phosphatase n=1 Tax=Streptomyces sp. NPDC057684 TaxID=3346211 RepID=UPI003682E689
MASDAPLMVIDGAGVVVEWSRHAEELLGHTAGDLVGQPATSLVRPTPVASGHAVGREQVALCHRSGRAVDADLRMRPWLRKDGSVAWAVFQVPADENMVSGVGTTVLEALFTQAPIPMYVLDPTLRIAACNAAAQAMWKQVPEQIVGSRLGDVYDFPAADDVQSILRGVLDADASSSDQVARFYARNASEAGCTDCVSVFRIEDRQGAVQGVAALVVDVTQCEQVRAHSHVVNAVRERVGQSLDLVTTCQDLVDGLVPGFADVAVVEVVDSLVHGQDLPPGPVGRDVPLRRAAFRNSAGEQAVQAHPIGDVRSLPSSTPYAQTLTDLKPRVVALDDTPSWLAADPARARAIRASGVCTLLAVPLTLRGTVLGLLSLYRTKRGDCFEEQEVGLAMELAAYTAVCLDNARRFAREYTIAATIQQHALAPCRPSQTGVQTAHLLVPGTQGAGSCFDALSLPSARTALVIGEVAGQGIHAAAAMGQVRTAVQTLVGLDLDADELLARLNDTVTSLARERAALPADEPLRRQPLTATCVYAIYDPLDRTCSIARAGHPPPVLVHPDGTTEILDLPNGPPLGSAGEAPFAQTTLSLTQGSVLAFYTTSLVSALSSDGPADLDSLRRLLVPGRRPLQDICDDVVNRLGSGAPSGDAVLLLARAGGFPTDRVATWDLDNQPVAVGQARERTRRRLAMWGVDDETAYTTELIVSELVTNAIRYGAPPVQLRLIKDRTLTCEVRDNGPSAPHLRHARTVDEGGRGLFISAQLSDDWGVRYTSDTGGKTVWAEQALPAQDPANDIASYGAV